MKRKALTRVVGAAVAVSVMLSCMTGYAKEFFAGEYSEEYHDGGYYAGYDPNYDCNAIDDQEVRALIDENFIYTSKSDVWFDDNNVPSGWDVRTIGGGLAAKYYFSDWQLIDESDRFPIEATRKFERLDHGKGVIEFSFSMPTIMNDVRWEIYKGRYAAFGIESKDGKLHAKKSGGRLQYLCDLKVDTTYGIKMEFDLDSKLVKNIYVNGYKKASNIPFLNSVDYIDNFNINTGDKTTGTLHIHTVQLYRGYTIYERFITTGNGFPEEYEVSKSGNADVVTEKADESCWPDYWHMLIKGAGGTASAKKSFDAVGGKQRFEFYMIMPTKEDGASAAIRSGGNNVAEISVRNGAFCFNGVPFYENYFENVWYNFQIDLDMNAGKADVYLNFKKKLSGVSINGTAADNVIFTKTGAGNMAFDAIKVYELYPEPEDYCPEPEPALSDDYHIGMQFCPMWKNGTHIGWDSLAVDKDRVPYIGYYDEDCPETADWIIKQLVEHGMSFQKVMWCNGANTSVAPQMGFIGLNYLNALMQAKYKSYMKFFVSWENQAMGSSTEHLLKRVGPFWIEHYFKDESYLKVDGRPVVTFYSLNDIIKGTAGETQEEKEANLKAGLETFRKMCIDAGVGNPIIGISATVTQAEQAQRFKDFGFDLVQPYGAALGSYYEQGLSTQAQVDANGEAGIWYMPNYGNGVDGTVWKSATTGYIPNSVFREAMESQKEISDNRDKSDPFYNWALVETYDETGEGHYILPCGRYGWEQFDTIRDTFVGESEHTDIVPTMKQKNRFNNLYPYGRNMPDLSNDKTPADIDQLVVKKAYNFDTDGDTEGWSVLNDVTGLTAKDGCLEGTVSGRDSQISISTLLDTDGINFIRIKMKQEGARANGQIFFSTDEYPGLSEAKSNFFAFYGEGFETKVMDMSSNVYWEGRLTTLRIDPFNSNDVGAVFKIDSIEFLGLPDVEKEPEIPARDKSGFKICYNGEYTKPEVESVTENGKTYFPLRAVAEVMGADRIDYDAKNNAVNVIKDESWVQLKLDNGAAYYNGGEVYGDNPYLVKDGTTYLSERMVNMAFGVDAEYDSDTETLKVGSDAGSVFRVREKLYAAEFEMDGDTEGWTNYSVTGMEAKDGKLIGKGSDAQENAPILFTKSDLGVPAESVKNISISYMNYSMSTSASLYFTTTDSPSYAEDKRISFKINPNDTGVTTYDIDPSTNKNWKGTIKSIRFDPQGNTKVGNFAIDWFRLEGDYMAYDPSASGVVTHMTDSEKYISWEFASNGDPDGWDLSKSLGNVKILDGYLLASVVGTEPALVTKSDLDLNADDIKKIKIKFKNNTISTKARLYFRTDDSDCYCDGKVFEIEIYPNDTVGAVYEITPQDNEFWTGKIRGFKLEPTYNKGDVAIDYIRLEK